MRRVAAIDLGTNTTLLLVAEVDAGGNLVKLEDRAAITRLGRGVDRSHRLDPAAVQGTLQVLREYREAADSWNASVVAVGTSVLRDAEDRDEFLLLARAILGPSVVVIDGDREAELTFAGALEGIELANDDLFMVVDIGGGSTELVVGRGRAIDRRASLNMGSVRMHERHALSAPVTPAQDDALRSEIGRQISGIEWSPPSALIATAATATTLGAMHLGQSYESTKVHGMRLSASDLTLQVRRLLGATLEERHRMAGLDPRRADVIAVGGLILDEIVKWCGSQGVTVSDGGVRYGLARENLGNFGR